MGRRVSGWMRSRSSSYVKSSGSDLGAYGLKSRIWPFERSRVRRKSKISGEIGTYVRHSELNVGISYNLHWKSILARY